MAALHLLHQSPLRLEEMARVAPGDARGEVRVITRHGAIVMLRGLQNAEAVTQRIAAQHQKITGSGGAGSDAAGASAVEAAEAESLSDGGVTTTRAVRVD